MVANKIVKGSGFDFASNPIQKGITSGTFSSTYLATSQGGVIGSTGLRIWDTGVLAASGNFTITPSTPLTIPLINTDLPTVLFDAIIDLNLDGDSYPLAFSNSPDNASFYTSSSTLNNNNLFWINLFRCRPNNAPASSQAAINYYFGGDPVNYGSSPIPNLMKLSLLKPLTQNTSFTYLMEYISLNGQVVGPWTNTINLTPTTPIRNIDLGDWPAGMSPNPVGYMKIVVTCSDPSFRSLLPFYHWGLAS